MLVSTGATGANLADLALLTALSARIAGAAKLAVMDGNSNGTHVSAPAACLPAMIACQPCMLNASTVASETPTTSVNHAGSDVECAKTKLVIAWAALMDPWFLRAIRHADASVVRFSTRITSASLNKSVALVNTMTTGWRHAWIATQPAQCAETNGATAMSVHPTTSWVVRQLMCVGAPKVWKTMVWAAERCLRVAHQDTTRTMTVNANLVVLIVSNAKTAPVNVHSVSPTR